MDGEDNLADSLLHIDKNAWEETTAQVIQSIEERCSRQEYVGAATQFGAQSEFTRPWSSHKPPRKARSKPEACITTKSKTETDQSKTSASDNVKNVTVVDNPPINTVESALDVQLEDIKYIDDSAKSSLSTSLTEAPAPIVQPASICRPQSPQQPVERSCASVLEERYCQAFISSKNEQIAESWNRHYTSPRLPPNHHPYVPKYKHEPRLVVSPLPPEKLKHEKEGTYSETDYYSRNSIGDSEHLNVQSIYIERDFR